MTRQRKTTTATALKRREAAARRTQDAVGPAGEITRLQAHVAELLAMIRQREAVIAGLRRELDDGEGEFCTKRGCA